MRAVIVVILAYLIGSIPFGYMIVRIMRGGDVRMTGSGGTGATNVSRSAGKVAGIMTLVLDFIKGAVVGVAASQAIYDPVNAAAAVAVIIGHIFPVWLRFRGGKGVATGAGVFLFLAPKAFIVAAAVFLVIVFLTRYVSLGSITAAATIPLVIYLQKSPQTLVVAALIDTALIIFAHRGNIGRLLSGTESKFT
jgi:acyl phosphate:glycerol-3-phosphate acyltransferase